MLSPLETKRAHSWQRIQKPDFACWQLLWLLEARAKKNRETWNKLGIGQPMAGVKQRDREKELPSPSLRRLTLHCAPRILPGPHHLVAYLQFFRAANNSKRQVGLKQKANKSSELQEEGRAPTIQMLLISWASSPHTSASLTVIHKQEALLKLPGCLGIRGLVQTSAVEIHNKR